MIEGRMGGDYANQAIKLPPRSDPLICCICGWVAGDIKELEAHKIKVHKIE